MSPCDLEMMRRQEIRFDMRRFLLKFALKVFLGSSAFLATLEHPRGTVSPLPMAAVSPRARAIGSRSCSLAQHLCGYGKDSSAPAAETGREEKQRLGCRAAPDPG